MRKIEVGSVVVYVDEFGKKRPALVTHTWGENGKKEYDPKDARLAINVVFVTDNMAETDSYGAQTRHETSVVHKSNQSAPGRYWFQE